MSNSCSLPSKLKLLAHKLLPVRLRWYLLDRDMRKMEEHPVVEDSSVCWGEEDDEDQRPTRPVN